MTWLCSPTDHHRGFLTPFSRLWPRRWKHPGAIICRSGRKDSGSFLLKPFLPIRGKLPIRPLNLMIPSWLYGTCGACAKLNVIHRDEIVAKP
jgi:hypothetical protein